MIVLAVMTYNGAATEPVEASFDELGGTIGRADGNLMVLPDPERTISRVHAKVVFRNGRYAIEDRGSNPILVNGNIVGHGKEWPLNPGDVIQIGGYELGVRGSGTPAASADPFADVFGEVLAPPASAAFATAPATAPAAAPASNLAFAPPAMARGAAAAGPATRPPSVAQARAAASIPSDWNPLAEDTAASVRAAPLGAGTLGGSLAASLQGPGVGEPSLDDLFGLGDKATPSAKGWPADEDFLGVFDPNGPASGGVGEPVVRPQIEDARLDHQRSELGLAFPNAVMPASVPAAPPVAAPPAAAAWAPDPLPPTAPIIPTTPPELQTRAAMASVRPQAEPPRGAVVSWDGGARQATIVAPSAASRRSAAAARPLGSRPGVRPAAAPVAAAAPAGSDELLAALLQGLGEGLNGGSAGGAQPPALPALTPELMRLIGTLLAESVRGAVDLLHARASVKREVRAEVTAIRPRQNNPLKFSPTAALALQHLLGPPVPGFLRGDDAMRDAFRDLRAHELAVMAGMRAALAGLLQRFDPKDLEAKISARSGLGLLLAGGRRAQLWDNYQQLYSQLSAEAEDDFHEVFGKAFLQAYEEQLDRLSNESGGGGGG